MSKPAVDKSALDLLADVSELLRTMGSPEVALNRPLFADSLTIAEVAAASEAKRKRLVVGRETAALNDMEGVLKEQRSLGEDVSRGMSAIAKRRKHVQEFARQEGVEKARLWRPDNQLKDLAGKHGRREAYFDLRVTHLFVHGSPFVTRQRVGQTDEGRVVVGGPAVDLASWANPTAYFAAESALHAAAAACDLFGWDEPANFDALATRLRDEKVKYEQEEGRSPLAR